MAAERTISLVGSGDRVYISSGCAEPERLVKALIGRRDQLCDLEILHLMTVGNADYVLPEMKGHFRHNAFFVVPNVWEETH